jgi:hypothetical protein
LTTTSTISTPSTTTLASPTTNPSTIIQCMAHYTTIANTATTGNYLSIDCPVTDRQPSTHQGVDVILPGGSIITSSHTATLQLPATLPLGARQVHIFPGLKSGSLISIGQLCDHGCTATFNTTQVQIFYQDKVIMTGFHSLDTNNLCVLTINDSTTPSSPHPSNNLPSHAPEPTIGTANIMMKYDTLAEHIAFYHAALFSPVISTWCDAIDNGHFTTWPGLTSAQVCKYLPRGSGPMIKGHLHQQHTNLWSTQPKELSIEQASLQHNNFHPPIPPSPSDNKCTYFVTKWENLLPLPLRA